MDETKIFSEILAKYGLSGLVMAYFVFEKVIHPAWKKHVSGSYVSWKDLKNQLERQGDHLKYLEDKVSAHLVREQEEDVRMAVLKERVDNNQEKLQKLDDHIEKMFTMLRDLETSWINRGQ